MNIESIYEDLTGVNIEEQKEIWNERGKGYYGEFLVFSELYTGLPGNAKILMNVQIPGLKTKKTELDLILIHETGIVVFEMKHYKGTIYGDITEHTWTQYFRTVPNQTFYNPVLQNEGHIAAMKAIFPDVPIRSFVVFTNEDVDLRIKGSSPDITVCALRNMPTELIHILKSAKTKYSMENIDDMFRMLLPFAPTMYKHVIYMGEAVPFHQYVDAIRNDFGRKITKLAQKNAADKQKHFRVCAGIFAAIAACVIIGSAYISRAYVKPYIDRAKEAESRAEVSEQHAFDAITKYEEMRRNFEYVDDIQQGEYEIADGVLTASDVLITPSNSIKDAVEVSGKIHVQNERFTFKFGDKTTVVVQLADGSVKEYGLFSQGKIGILKNSSYGPVQTTTIEYTPTQKLVLTGLDIDEIAYIKLKNIGLYPYPIGNVLQEGLELELYNDMRND